tara:strand:+ start:119 stop:529 length:411 start_codon:yes stop_codon:yes gene_type:complete
MNTFEIKYKGDLRTTAIHLDSGSEISTDAPKDNHGLGETFSPTDMVCTALASCILTIMAIAVERDDIDIKGTTAVVKKTMGKNPRRISKIDIDLTFPREYDQKTKTILERAAYNCPVHHTLSETVEKNISFNYLSK